MNSEFVKSAIHTISSALEIPAIIVLILLVVLVLVSLGSLSVEFFVGRIGKKLDAPSLIKSLSRLTDEEKLKRIVGSEIQKQQKFAFKILLESKLAPDERRLLAVQLLTDEEKRLDKMVSLTDIIARIAPMFGLMATLIPLGPGLIALGQGDTKGLADSLLTAFDATVTGLASAGIAYVISKIRKRWYKTDLETFETVMEEVIL